MEKNKLVIKYLCTLDRDCFSQTLAEDYVCCDDFIHVRLKNYTKPQIISGFVNKLSFVLTYLFNKKYTVTINDSKITDFKTYWDIHSRKFIEFLNTTYPFFDTTNIKISKAYAPSVKMTNPTEQFGNINCNDIINEVELLRMVFTENIDIVLTLNTNDICYKTATKKFKNKITKKANKKTLPKVTEVNIFES